MTSALALCAPAGVDGVYDIRAAVLSLYLHHHNSAGQAVYVPPKFRPLPFDVSLRVIADRAQDFDQWAALAHVVEAGLHLRTENVAAVDQFVDRLRRDNETIGEQEAKDIKAEIRTINPRHDAARRAAVSRVFALRTGSSAPDPETPACELPKTTVTFDPYHLVTTIRVVVDGIKNRSTGEMAMLVNPAYWTKFHPAFRQGYLCRLDRLGSDLYQTDPPRAPGGPVAAEAAWASDFFEQVTIEDPVNGDPLAEFRNILKIQYSGTKVGSRGDLPWLESPEYQEELEEIELEEGRLGKVTEWQAMEFDLRRSLSTNLGTERLGPGIDVDEGWALAVRFERDRQWRWSSSKKLRFIDQTPNIVLTSMIDVGQWMNYLTPAVAGASLADSMHAAALREPPFNTEILEAAGAAGFLVAGDTWQ